MAVQEWGGDSRRPQTWIPLQTMARRPDGKPDARRLQTWAQNINDSALRDVVALQTPERRRASSPISRRKEVMSWAESRRSFWRDEDERRVDCDDMECFPLAPMQTLFFDAGMHGVSEAGASSLSQAEFWCAQSLLLRVQGEGLDVEAAVASLVSRHAMLRARFRPVGDFWVQVVLPEATGTYRFRRHRHVDDEEMEALTEASRAALDPAEGPVFAAELVRNDEETLLFLAAHHLVVDAASWRVLVHDLDEMLRGGLREADQEAMPFPHWVDYQSYEMSQRLFEPTLPFEVLPADAGYWGLDRDTNLHADVVSAGFSLDVEAATSLQTSCARVLRTDTADVFLAALLLSFRRTFHDRTTPTLWKRETGRDVAHDDLDVSRTVGCFASLCPVGVAVEPTTDLVHAVKLVKDTRRAIPRNGVPFFAAEFGSPEGTSVEGVPVEVLVDWVEHPQIHRQGGVLTPKPLPGQAPDGIKPSVGDKLGRLCLFDVSVVLDPRGAHVSFSHSTRSQHQDRIRVWRQTFESLVREAVPLLGSHEPELTLSDVPLLRTSYKALARLGPGRLAGTDLPPVRDIETVYPVTPAQQEILMAQSRDVDAFHAYAVYELSTPGKPVDAARLCRAWEAIVANKPALRSIFIDGVSREGLFDQVVLAKVSPNMLFIESSRPDEAVRKLPGMKTGLTEPRHRLSVCHASGKTVVRVDVSQAVCDVSSDGPYSLALFVPRAIPTITC